VSDKPLAGKTALVTGASRNIGRAIALKLAGAGADIVVNTLKDRDAAEARDVAPAHIPVDAELQQVRLDGGASWRRAVFDEPFAYAYSTCGVVPGTTAPL
jgi:NAD(P)-dependent dehydrogenase (short-subunit alcohol dehydrogenase family)